MLVSDLRTILSSVDSSDYLLFDNREKEEYQQSHIRNALWVDPDISSKDFIKRFGSQIAGKHLVFYCSVGKRSSIFVERVMKSALEYEARSLSNLRGGIFRWYNEGYPVFNDSGETDDIHPYDSYWGQLIQKRD